MADKRNLKFSDLNEALAEAEILLTNGYEQTGSWNLGQCCGHLNLWLSYPMDGFPKNGIVFGPILWMMKTFMGKKMLADILKDGFKAGTPTNPKTVMKPDQLIDGDSVVELQQTIERFNAHSGNIHDSPVFGAMDKDTALKLQLRHFEHHLSFLVPKS